MADHDFLAIDDVMIAVPDRLGRAIGNVAAPLRFGEHLPYGDFPARHRRQELPLLFLRAPFEDDRSDDARQSIENV